MWALESGFGIRENVGVWVGDVFGERELNYVPRLQTCKNAPCPESNPGISCVLPICGSVQSLVRDWTLSYLFLVDSDWSRVVLRNTHWFGTSKLHRIPVYLSLHPLCGYLIWQIFRFHSNFPSKLEVCYNESTCNCHWKHLTYMGIQMKECSFYVYSG